MLKVEVPKNKEKFEQQISALKYMIATDVSDMDRKIHTDALRCLEKAYKDYEQLTIENIGK